MTRLQPRLVLTGTMVAAGALCLAYGCARAAEVERPTHRLVVCVDHVCEERERTRSETACLLDAASMRLAEELPAGARIMCRRMR